MSEYEEEIRGWVPRYRLSGFWAVISSPRDVSNVRGTALGKDFGFKVREGVATLENS